MMVWQGVGYSMGAAAIWPSLSVVVPDELCSTAYGLMTSVQNIGMCGFPLIIGILQSSPKIKGTINEYAYPIYIFIACECLAFLLSITLWVMDKRITGGMLSVTASQRKQLAESRKRAGAEELARQRVVAQHKLDMLRKANEQQNQLLVRDVFTNRSAYYLKLGVNMDAPTR